jgi:hypothetical protein
MTREEFIQVLEKKGYSYKIEGDKIVVTHEGRVDLRSLQTLPTSVEFMNGGYVDLDSLKTLPPGVVFMNGGDVDLRSLQTLPPGVVFKNRGSVYLPSLVREGFKDWSGNIEGVDSKRLLKFMISKGVFI